MRKRSAVSDLMSPQRKLLLSVEEAAIVLSLGRNSTYDLILRGRIESIKIGRLRRVPVEALHRFVSQQVLQAKGI
jgi:excisionase family DNA binding protein